MDNGCIELSNVTVRRSKRTILNVDNFGITAGQFVNVIGTNGAGKTTLLSICCGLIKPNTGSVKFDGIDLTLAGWWQRIELRKHIGYVPQSAEYNAELPFTVREVITMGRTSAKSLCSTLGKEDYDIIDSWLEELGLEDRRNQTFRSLSGGEQQKTLIARAMTQHPDVLMLDEPGANLDFNWKHKIAALVEDLHRKTSITILMVSHDADLLPVDEGRTILLHEGKILADGSIRDVFESDSFEKAYGYKFKVLDLEGRKYVLSRGK